MDETFSPTPADAVSSKSDTDLATANRFADLLREEGVTSTTEGAGSVGENSQVTAYDQGADLLDAVYAQALAECKQQYIHSVLEDTEAFTPAKQELAVQLATKPVNPTELKRALGLVSALQDAAVTRSQEILAVLAYLQSGLKTEPASEQLMQMFDKVAALKKGNRTQELVGILRAAQAGNQALLEKIEAALKVGVLEAAKRIPLAE